VLRCRYVIDIKRAHVRVLIQYVALCMPPFYRYYLPIGESEKKKGCTRECEKNNGNLVKYQIPTVAFRLQSLFRRRLSVRDELNQRRENSVADGIFPRATGILIAIARAIS